MYRSHDQRRDLRSNPFPALLAHTKIPAQHALRSARAQQDDNFRPSQFDFRIEPGTAGTDFECARFFMDAALATRLPLEVLDDVSHVNIIAVDPRSLKCLVQYAACGPYKWTPLKIFFVAGLLADHEHPCVRAALAKNCLRAAFPQVAPLAQRSSFAQTW